MGTKNSILDETSIIVRKIYTPPHTKVEHRIHTNDGHELYLLLQGDVSFSIDGSIYKVEPMDMLLISNKEIHRTIVNPEFPHERIYIYFDPDVVSQLTGSEYELLDMFEKRELGFGNKIERDIVKQNELYSSFMELYQWYRSKEPERYVMMISVLLKLLVKINKICENSRREAGELGPDIGYNEKIYKVIRYISMNLDRKISLDELEENFYINKYHLCHLFKEITGFSVMEYANYKKILAAREKLKKGKPISEVWVNLGFEDYSSFYRTFKKVSGISPKEYSSKH